MEAKAGGLARILMVAYLKSATVNFLEERRRDIKISHYILPAQVAFQRLGNCPIWHSEGVSVSAQQPTQSAEAHNGSQWPQISF